jgi:hypothetical protein
MEKKLRECKECENYARFLSLLEKIDKQRSEANAKLAAVKNALPSMTVLGAWGSGPRAFVERFYGIINAP